MDTVRLDYSPIGLRISYHLLLGNIEPPETWLKVIKSLQLFKCTTTKVPLKIKGTDCDVFAATYNIHYLFISGVFSVKFTCILYELNSNYLRITI